MICDEGSWRRREGEKQREGGLEGGRSCWGCGWHEVSKEEREKRKRDVSELKGSLYVEVTE